MKRLILILSVLLALCACTMFTIDKSKSVDIPSNATKREYVPSPSETFSTSSVSSASSIQEEEVEPSKNEFFRVNLNGGTDPEPIRLGFIHDTNYFERIREFAMSPDCTMIWGGYRDVKIVYNCLDNLGVDFYNCYGAPEYLRFIKGNHLAIYEQMQAEIKRPDDEADSNVAIVQPNTKLEFTYFESSFLNSTGKHFLVDDFDYDVKLQRYYCTGLFNNDTMNYPISCAEYDKDYNLLYYMIADNIEILKGIKNYKIDPTIIALGSRKVYTNYGVEFDFNTLTYQRKDYGLPKMFYEDNESTLDPVYHTHGNKNNQYILATYNDGRVISYVGDELRTLYKTPETVRDPDSREPISSYEVQTNQGIITVSGYGVGAWAPDEGVYIGGSCKKYQWEMPDHLKEYFQADYYEYGIFKLLPDGTIHFVLPLPKGIDFIGEDINGMSYFYKRTF